MITVELEDVFGDDLRVVNAARVSYGKFKKMFDEKDKRLIKYLVEHKHLAPFRHPQLYFRVSCPIYVERQLFKHQVGMSANSISGRYVDFSDTYTRILEISKWKTQSESSKQGSGEPLNDNEQKIAFELENEVIKFCSEAYKKLLELGVAKEQARTILPLNLNTTYVWTGSLLSFLHLWNLRLKPDAQEETRYVAQKMLDLVKETGKFNESLAAFGF